MDAFDHCYHKIKNKKVMDVHASVVGICINIFVNPNDV